MPAALLSTKKRAGNPSYAGYEYQIEVTIWIALDLLLAKTATNELIIEPPSYEDIEASVEYPDKALLGLTAQVNRIDLIFQVKTRSGAPWSSKDFAKVLTGKQDEKVGKARARIRPLDLLKADSHRRYVFITNEALAKPLRIHQGQHIFDFPEVTELPPFIRKGFDAFAQKALAPRILLCAGITEEVLEARIGSLLAQYGHVPKVNHVACMTDLRNDVRKYIGGHADGRWTREKLVEVLGRHGGSVAPTREMDHYVRPSSFDRIQKKLDQSHVVVIAGPSGTGKTLTADILESVLRREDPPFKVVGEEHGPSYVRAHLAEAGEVLFHLRDPWGGNRLMPGADRWGGELLKLLNNAGPEKKFLITTRSDVLQSAGAELMKDLEHYIVSIEIDDYGPKRLQQIYDGIASDLVSHAQLLAQAYRQTALKSLQRPYEIVRFLVALSQEDAQKPRKVDDIVTESQINAISGIIAKQIEPFGEDGVASSAIIWAALVARKAVTRGVFPKLLRRMRAADSSFRPDVEGLIDFLVAGNNLRQDGEGLSFYHPKAEDGLRMAFMRHTTEAEHVLSLVMDGLSALDFRDEDWGIETVLMALRTIHKLDGLEVILKPVTQKRLDVHLETNAMMAGRHLDFERALDDLTRFGSADYLPSQLAHALIEGGSEPDKIIFLQRWRPPVFSSEEIKALRNDARTRPLVERFVREVLPFTRTNYDLAIAPFLLEIVSGIETAFWDALDTVAGPGGPHENIEVIVVGACAGSSPDFDRAIARFAQSEEEVGVWMEKEYAERERKAEEHEVDAIEADHIMEEPQERYYNAQTGIEAVVKLRRAHEGFVWIADNPHRQSLITASANLIAQSQQVSQPVELQFLLSMAENWTRHAVWRAAKQHWQVQLEGLLRTELAKSGLDKDLRSILIKIAALNNEPSGDLVALLAEVAHQVPAERQLELVYDVMNTSLNGDRGEAGQAARRTRAERLSDTFDVTLKELGRLLASLLAGGEIRSSAQKLSVTAQTRLASLLPTIFTDIAGPLLCVAAAIGIDIDFKTIARRMLATGDVSLGKAVVQALLIDNRDSREVLHEAMTHKQYRVRRIAVDALVRAGYSEDQDRLLAAAADQSAEVRLAWVRLMEEYKWPKAVDSLVELLADRRDFSSDYGGTSWSKFSVARGAAHALGAYDKLPAYVVTTLLEVVEEKSRDPFVACAAISALTNQDDDRISDVINVALESTGLKGALEYRPLAQAAAWALFDRAVAEKLVKISPAATRMALEDRPPIAGPLLMAFGILNGRERQELLDALHQASLTTRVELVRVTASASGKTSGLTLEGREITLARLGSGVSLDQFRSEERTKLEEWGRSIDTTDDVKYFTAWIVNVVSGLSTSEDFGDPRAFVLPERVSMLTMRSLTTMREESAGPDDGT